MASWKLESSATNHSPSPRSARASVGGVPMLPTERAAMPASRMRCVVSEVVVVLPLVPVIATQRSGLSRKASSTSPTSSREQAAAERRKAESSGIPGEATARS